MTAEASQPFDANVRLFNASLIWPLQLEPLAIDASRGRHWAVFEASDDTSLWQRVDD